MRIAQIAPLAESCPPKLYGGTERIVSFLTEELVRQGHEVTLFASGDSRTAARLVSCGDLALRLNPRVRDPIPYYMLMLDELLQRAGEFDVMHFHIDLLHYPLFRNQGSRIVTTLHGRLDLPDLWPFYAAFAHLPLVSISHAQRAPMPPVRWAGTVYHGLPRDLLPFTPRPMAGRGKPGNLRDPGRHGSHDGDYLAFLGRISPEKGPDRAIEIAARAGLTLKIAAKVDKADQAYWDQRIAPMVKAHPNVDYIGEIDEGQKADFLGNARALLFPIDWPEPFGLVMIESMACGTPVIAYRAGSVPEIIDAGITGYVVGDVDEAVDAVRRAEKLDRRLVRDMFETRFTAERMARDYVDIYREVISGNGTAPQRDADDGEPPGLPASMPEPRPTSVADALAAMRPPAGPPAGTNG